jgi:plastocyanin
MRAAGRLGRWVALSIVFGAACVLQACAAATAPSTAPVASDRVDMPRSYRFAPEAITVTTGTTVTWTNSDQFTHSVRLLDSGADVVVRPGETGIHTFASAGLYRYTCTFHPNDMNGTVLVTDAP